MSGSGHVFHPGHQELHGVTVVLETNGPRTYVGRFDKEDASGVHILNVGIHEAGAAGMSKEEYLQRTTKFGVRVEEKYLVVPTKDVAKITPLGSLT